MPPILGVVLAGGLSRRMGGGDKPLLTLAGRTLLDRVTERFAPQCEAGTILNANGDPARFAGFPGLIVPDGVPGHPGPLAGLLAALDHAATLHPHVTHVASVTGDAPFLPLDLVTRLAEAISSTDPIPLPHPEVLRRQPQGRPPLNDERSGDLLRGLAPAPRNEVVAGEAQATMHAIAVASSGGRQHFTMALWSVSLRDDLRAALVEREERRVGAFLARHGAVAVEWPCLPVDPFLNVNTPDDLAAAEAALPRWTSAPVP